MRRLKRAVLSGGLVVGLLTALLLAGAATATATTWTGRSDVVHAGWGEDPAHVVNATWTTLLVNRDFASTSGLGRTIFVGISGTDSAHPNGYWAF